MCVDDATLVVDRIHHVLRDHRRAGRDNRAARLPHLVSLRQLV